MKSTSRNLVFMGMIMISFLNAYSQGMNEVKQNNEIERNKATSDSSMLPRNPYKITITYSSLLNKIYWVFQPIPYTNNYNKGSHFPEFNHRFHIHHLDRGLGKVFIDKENDYARQSLYLPTDGYSMLINKNSYFRFTGVPLPHKAMHSK